MSNSQKYPFPGASGGTSQTPPNHAQGAVRHGGPVLCLLDHRESRKNAVVASTIFHGVMLSVLLLVPFLLTERLNLARYSLVLIAPPPPKKEILEVTPYRAPAEAPKPVERLIAPPPPIPELRLPEAPSPR
jgi:hypothetical protein